MVLQPVVFIETQMFQGDGRCYPKLFLQIFLGREHPDLGHPPPPPFLAAVWTMQVYSM